MKDPDLETLPDDSDPRTDEPAPGEEDESLWWIAAAPTIWALHFLLSYVTGAIACAKAAERSASLGGARIAIAVYTVVALLGIAAVGVHGLRRHRLGTATVPHDFDTPEDRHRFLGFATLLLAGLSFVGILYVAAPAVVFGTCQ
jgi:hypothetical protein